MPAIAARDQVLKLPIDNILRAKSDSGLNLLTPTWGCWLQFSRLNGVIFKVFAPWGLEM
jgi:hypothetical protein